MIARQLISSSGASEASGYYKEKRRDPFGGNESRPSHVIGFTKLCQNLRYVGIYTTFSVIYIIKKPTVTEVTRQEPFKDSLTSGQLIRMYCTSPTASKE